VKQAAIENMATAVGTSELYLSALLMGSECRGTGGNILKLSSDLGEENRGIPKLG
jgi:hypothetical protein